VPQNARARVLKLLRQIRPIGGASTGSQNAPGAGMEVGEPIPRQNDNAAHRDEHKYENALRNFSVFEAFGVLKGDEDLIDAQCD
jgi:hypothetical protein